MKKLVRFEIVAEIDTDCETESLVETLLMASAKYLAETVAEDAEDVIEWTADNIPGYVGNEEDGPLPKYSLSVVVVSSEVKFLAEGAA